MATSSLNSSLLIAATAIALLFPTAAQAQPAITPAAAWGSTPKPFPDRMRQTPKLIVLHHEGVAWKPGTDPKSKLKKLQTWGLAEKGWLDVPYHYAIAPDGQILEGPDIHYRPDSNTNYNLDGVLNVELMGNFETDKVTPDQLESLVSLLAYLCQEYGIDPDSLTSHRLQAPGQTVCPGEHLQRYLDGPLKDWVKTSPLTK